MKPATSVAPATTDAKRMLLVDVLRAVALFGIIINHITTGYLAGPPPAGNENFNVLSGVDGVFNIGSFIFTFGKFFTIFSFLFGLSFAIQMDSAARNGRSFNATFLWRITILFVIGYIHNLFYSGDILVIYAFLGLLLLPFRFLSHKIIVPLALLLILNVPALVLDIIHVTTPVSAADVASQKAFGEMFAKVSQEQYKIKSEGTVFDVMKMNAVDGMIGKLIFQVISGRLWITFGLFLLGMYAGRRKIFVYNDRNKRLFKKLFVLTGIIALVSTVIAMLYGNPMAKAATAMQVLGNFSYNVHQASLSAFYVSGVALLYWKIRSATIPSMLAAAGQMGLTTYLVQSAFGVLLYYGFGLGLMGKIGVAISIAIGIAFFILQLFIAKWWMSQFRYGPVEWLWRSITYFKLQPLRKELRVVVLDERKVGEPVSV